MARVLFVCLHNAGRSQMSRALFERDAGGRHEAQSAIGLKERGLRVVVVEDAVWSPGEMHDRGLARMTAEGVELNHCKGLAYEWVRSVDQARSVLHAPEVGEPPFRL